MSDKVKSIVSSHYGFEVLETVKLTVGAGSNTYFVLTDTGKYILKNANISKANHPQNEPKLCEHLLSKGITVSEFIKDTNGEFQFSIEGQLFHMQKFVEGVCFEWNTAPDWLLIDSAKTLGQIHTALEDYAPLPIGIGIDFFKIMTPENALKTYKKSYHRAIELRNTDYAEDIAFRMELMMRFSVHEIALDKLSCKNTHGDYFISQLICGERRINAVIDWTTACIHPVVWEIMRSYIYAAPECYDGKIDIVKFVNYVKAYLKYSNLNAYDIAMMPYVFYYQISVCDYYNQYYQSSADNREIYLKQAILSTKLMRWFDTHIKDFVDFLNKEIHPS